MYPYRHTLHNSSSPDIYLIQDITVGGGYIMVIIFITYISVMVIKKHILPICISFNRGEAEEAEEESDSGENYITHDSNEDNEPLSLDINTEYDINDDLPSYSELYNTNQNV